MKEAENYVLVPIANNPGVDELFFCRPCDVHAHLTKLLAWCTVKESKVPMLTLLTILQYNFLRIHPFEDFNGRMSRLMMAFYCMRNDYPTINIDPVDKPVYFRVLSLAHIHGDLLPLAKFLGQAMIKGYNKIAKDLGSKK